MTLTLQAKLIIAGILVFIGIIIGGSAAWYIQGSRVKSLQADLEKMKADLGKCTDANTSNKKTIDELRADAKTAKELCSDRLKVKERLFQKLQKIDSIKTVKTNEKSTANTADPLLAELNSMFVNSADRKN